MIRTSSVLSESRAVCRRRTEARRLVTYGLSEGADLRAVNLEFHERGTSFEVPGVGFFKLFVPGEHNVRNALAAIAVARYFGIAVRRDRRRRWRSSSASTAASRSSATTSARSSSTTTRIIRPRSARRSTPRAAAIPSRRIVALFQPHLFSRTRDFAREFGESLRVADVPIVAPIYAAREEPVDGISARIISDSVPGIEFLDRSNAEIVNEMRRRLRPNDIFITMGAGDVHEIAEELVRGEV